MPTRKECAVTKEFACTVFLSLVRETFATKLYRNCNFRISTKSLYEIQVTSITLSKFIASPKILKAKQMLICSTSNVNLPLSFYTFLCITDRWSRNAGNQLPNYTAYYPRTSKASSTWCGRKVMRLVFF